MWFIQQPVDSPLFTMHVSRGQLEPFPLLRSHIASPTVPAQTIQRLSAHPRAVRQRRKDPSCDACRERKVKCDATDSMTCSECQSRGIRCHFTKESSRRLSTARQVQDLERQLTHVIQENRQLRSLLRRGGRTIVENIEAPLSQPAGSARSRSLSMQPQSEPNLDFARQRLWQNTHGLFDPPRWRTSEPFPSMDWQGRPGLPAQDITNRAIENSADAWYWRINLVDRERFISDCNNIYRSGSFALHRDAWIALFYAVLCSGLALDPDMANFSFQARQIAVRIARQPHLADIDVCRAALVLCQSFFDNSLKFDARLWMSVAVLHATTLGLDIADHLDDALIRQERDAVYFSIYIWDRFLSQDLSKPTFMSDQSERLQYDHQSGLQGPEFLYLRTLIAASRIGDSLARCLQTMSILPDVVLSIEKAIDTVEMSLPQFLNSNAPCATQVGTIWVTAALTNLRILLHRHKLNLRHSLFERSTGLSQCAAAARRTAQMIARSNPLIRSLSGDMYSDSLQSSAIEPFPDIAWTTALRASTTAQFCLHLWRCLLFLSFSADFPSARICAQAARAIGNVRPINTAAGRNSIFFLGELLKRVRQGFDQSRLEKDEEMIVYVSGDMQSDPYNAWVWSLDGGPVRAREIQSSNPLVQAPSSTLQSPQSRVLSTGHGHDHACQDVNISDEQVWNQVLELLRSIEREYILQQHQRRVRSQGQFRERDQLAQESTERASFGPIAVQGQTPQQAQYAKEAPEFWSKSSEPESSQQDQGHEREATVQESPSSMHRSADKMSESGPSISGGVLTTAAGPSFAERMSIASLLGEDRPGYYQDFPLAYPQNSLND